MPEPDSLQGQRGHAGVPFFYLLKIERHSPPANLWCQGPMKKWELAPRERVYDFDKIPPKGCSSPKWLPLLYSGGTNGCCLRFARFDKPLMEFFHQIKDSESSSFYIILWRVMYSLKSAVTSCLWEASYETTMPKNAWWFIVWMLTFLRVIAKFKGPPFYGFIKKPLKPI